MASIQLGEGAIYDGSIVPFEPDYRSEAYRPESVGLVFHTSRGDSQVNFPITITLEIDEALDLASRICLALKVRERPAPQRLVGRS